MLAGIALAMLARIACAHDIPNDVKVQAFVKPEGRRLQLLVRVPMSAMREADVPVRGPGYLDLPRADAALRTAVRLWLVDNIEVYEGDDRLPAPRIADVRVAVAGVAAPARRQDMTNGALVPKYVVAVSSAIRHRVIRSGYPGSPS